MGGRGDVTRQLGDALVRGVFGFPDPRVYWSREVTFDCTGPKPVRVDFMRYKPRNQCVAGLEAGEFHCFEIKSCAADLRSGHGMNFLGDRNYVVCPDGLVPVVRDVLPFGVGIYAMGPQGTLECVKPSRLDYRRRSALECMFAMMRSNGRDAINARSAQS